MNATKRTQDCHPNDSTHQSNRQRGKFQRRAFLLGLIATGASAVAPNASADQAPVALLPSNDNPLMRVRMEIDVKGNVDLPTDPLVSRKSDLQLPIESDAVLDYEERYRLPEGADPNSVVTAVERFYHEAKSSSKINRAKQEVKLRDSVQHTHVRRDSLPETIYSVEDYFTHDELGLLRVPVSSVDIDKILPSQAVKVGSKYQPSEEAVTSFLNVTTVQSTNIIVEVTKVEATNVKFQFRGKVEASVDGVPTTINTVGKLTFDRGAGTCTWLAMAIHETREIGRAEPGFDVAATIKMVRRPMAKPVGLPTEPPEMAITKSVPQDRLYIDVAAQRIGVSIVMDRRWRMMSDLTGNAMLRMIDNDRSIAQCNLRPLASLTEGKQWTLEAFERDVKTTLGNELETMVEADQRLSAAGLRVLRIVADGAVQGVPVRWIMMHFSDDSGRRLLATFTMSEDRVEEFAGADNQLADSLSLTEMPVRKAPDTEETDFVDADSTKKEVAAKNEVQSASDLR